MLCAYNKHSNTRLSVLYRPLATFSQTAYKTRNLQVGFNEIALVIHTDNNLNFYYPTFIDFRFIPGDKHNNQFCKAQLHNHKTLLRQEWQKQIVDKDFKSFAHSLVCIVEQALAEYPRKRQEFYATTSQAF